ncbi:MAG: Gfo/Idh/MocA family oxidoreductase [Deltaproteobacteria bacterium]|nr:Gfo/Idh/MocA family oxidoreductase [Deltaproteobacteria bacterium]
MNGDLRWGVLGTADISTEVIPAIQRSRAGTVTAVASRTAAKARKWADRFGIRTAFGSYDDMLASGEVDVVYVPLPNSMHAKWTIRALEAGLPVLCEKPLAATADEANQVADASRRTGLFVMEGFMYRFHPLWRRVRDLVEDGTIGELATIDAVFTFFLDDRASIVTSAELAGGALMDVGCYPVNLSRWMAGAEPGRVAAFERGSAVDDRWWACWTSRTGSWRGSRPA